MLVCGYEKWLVCGSVVLVLVVLRCFLVDGDEGDCEDCEVDVGYFVNC